MGNTNIVHALLSLDKRVNDSELSNNEKNALKVLIEKLLKYYKKKIEEINKTSNFYIARNKDFKLTSEMTDYIVAINDAIKRKIDTFGVANTITRKINAEEKKGFFKIKRLSQ